MFKSQQYKDYDISYLWYFLCEDNVRNMTNVSYRLYVKRGGLLDHSLDHSSTCSPNYNRSLYQYWQKSFYIKKQF